MSSATTTSPSPVHHPPSVSPALSKGKVGMIAFLTTEVAFFGTLITTYITYIGADQQPRGMGGPTPDEVFTMPLVLASTVCLLSSSVTIHLAGNAAHHRDVAGFRSWWLATIGLGALFIVGTMYEWHDLIFTHQLTPWRNLFGSTYFTLVGFHALHVTIGLIIMSMLFIFAEARSKLPDNHPLDTELVSWYWHFVDGVWIVVFTVVYLVSR
ncbi:MAG: heme-copper oxidase subunit III [Gemmataceae bacterium]|nr:heme-copper oxidase subunit III [Gemmataceae bacterium]